MRAVEMVEGLDGLQYGERLTTLKLPTLAFRRLRGLAIEVWKHFNAYDSQVLSDSFVRSRSPRYPLDLRLHKSKRKQLKSFYHRAPSVCVYPCLSEKLKTSIRSRTGLTYGGKITR